MANEGAGNESGISFVSNYIESDHKSPLTGKSQITDRGGIKM